MKIEDIRKAAHRTQQEMANEMVVAVRTVANWEAAHKGVKDLSPLMRSQVEKFARKHNIKMEG
jgi:DNA-binding transcriptional regulator YiaG